MPVEIDGYGRETVYPRDRDMEKYRIRNTHPMDPEVIRLREIISRLGACPDCGQMQHHHLTEPFSSCSCGTGEDYGKRPIQAMQIRIYELLHKRNES